MKIMTKNLDEIKCLISKYKQDLAAGNITDFTLIEVLIDNYCRNNKNPSDHNKIREIYDLLKDTLHITEQERQEISNKLLMNNKNIFNYIKAASNEYDD